jgi:agmatine deiminase
MRTSETADPGKVAPAALGYCMPAEWEPHAATWIAWPHNRSDWPGKFGTIPWVYAEIVRQLVRGEAVHILVQNIAGQRHAQQVLRAASVNSARIHFHCWPTDRVWTRDSGPIFLLNTGKRELALTAWRFNAWAKYSDFKRDATLPQRIAAHLTLPCWEPAITMNDRICRFVLEGGSIDVNGRGTLLTTEECLLSKVQQRNPGVSRRQIERVLADYLGTPKVIWLDSGIAGDDTHGHVDDIARFVAPNAIVAAVETNRKDFNYKPLQENLKRLKRSTDQNGRPLRIIELPMPRPIVFQGRRLPASYANFYIANTAVLVPTFNDASDRIALNLLASLFPGREVVGIYSGDFIWGFGAMHCMTQQQPAV